MAVQFNPFTGNLDIVGAGASATPGGSDTQVQFNNAGAFGGSADLTWDDTGKVLGVGGDIDLDDGGTYATTLQVITPTADRTISYPDATGTLALVAGSSGQLIYNNAGANAGTPTLTYDGSILTSTGRFINSYNAAGIASAPAKAFTGTWFTGGTATTTKPHVLIEPSGTTSQAWSTSGTGLGINAASGFTGNLLDLQVDGVTKFYAHSNVSSEGVGIGPINANNTPQNGFVLNAGLGLIGNNSTAISSGAISVLIRRNLGALISDAEALCFGNTFTLATGTKLFQDAAGILAQRNGTNAQTYRLYNTYTSATSFERAKLSWESNVFKIGVEKGSSGGTARSFELQTDGVTRVRVAGDQSQINFLDGSGTTQVNIAAVGSIGIRVANGYGYTFTPAAANLSSPDAGFYRDSAGVIKITNGSTGTGYLKQTPVAVSALPAAATVGAGTRGFVSDSTVAASGNFGATVAGGGSNNVPVFSDGTNWLIG